MPDSDLVGRLILVVVLYSRLKFAILYILCHLFYCDVSGRLVLFVFNKFIHLYGLHLDTQYGQT